VKGVAASAAITALNSSNTIEVAGVYMDEFDLGAPTPEEIEKFCLVELKDGDEADPKVPQYGSHTIYDYKEFTLAFPYLSREDIETKNLLPYTYCGYNKLARNIILENRNKREPNDEEWEKIGKYAEENGNNTLMQTMNAGFVGYRNIYSFYNVGF
jgi:hypothetical protein